MEKVYSKINQIPWGHASLEIKEGCVVCEGGAFRAVYGEGVLDAMMENDLNMECTIGVSAGAMNGYNYVAGQIGRSARFNLSHRFDLNYVGGPKTILHNKGIIGSDYAFGPIREEPFDRLFFERETRRFVAVVTNCLDGQAYYMEKGKCSDIEIAIQASASLPFASSMVEVDGMPCLDGGISDHIPVQWAIDQGYKKIIVIKTQHNDYRKNEDEKMDPMIDVMYHKYPSLCEKLKNMNHEYNETCDYIDELRQQGKIFVISPSINDPASRLEHDIEKLGDWYFLGYQDAYNQMEELKNYLNQKD
ncbi:patatin-like phospholipase family protein [Floccifex sp.]|uniref:patatin-like phospholipase family protein n=1 Tax=Floccifex sp. TaxID=2815810 RepID=UPI003F074C92